MAAVEFALVGSLLFITMLGVMDMARYYLTLIAARNVVAQAGRAMMISPTLTTLNSRTCNSANVISATGGMSFVTRTGTLCVTMSQPVNGNTTLYEARVELTAPFTFLVRILGLSTVTIVEDQRFRFNAG